jgi:NAD(P)H-nitrite reductase large subunit
VVGINAIQHLVQMQNGKHISYSKLLLANGARPRYLSCPGLNLAGVSTLRTVADYQQILPDRGVKPRSLDLGIYAALPAGRTNISAFCPTKRRE